MATTTTKTIKHLRVLGSVELPDGMDDNEATGCFYAFLKQHKMQLKGKLKIEKTVVNVDISDEPELPF